MCNKMDGMENINQAQRDKHACSHMWILAFNCSYIYVGVRQADVRKLKRGGHFAFSRTLPMIKSQ